MILPRRLNRVLEIVFFWKLELREISLSFAGPPEPQAEDGRVQVSASSVGSPSKAWGSGSKFRWHPEEPPVEFLRLCGVEEVQEQQASSGQPDLDIVPQTPLWELMPAAPVAPPEALEAIWNSGIGTVECPQLGYRLCPTRHIPNSIAPAFQAVRFDFDDIYWVCSQTWLKAAADEISSRHLRTTPRWSTWDRAEWLGSNPVSLQLTPPPFPPRPPGMSRRDYEVWCGKRGTKRKRGGWQNAFWLMDGCLSFFQDLLACDPV